MMRKIKNSKKKRIFAFVLATLLLLQSMTVYGTETATGTDLVIEESTAEEGEKGPEESNSSKSEESTGAITPDNGGKEQDSTESGEEQDSTESSEEKGSIESSEEGKGEGTKDVPETEPTEDGEKTVVGDEVPTDQAVANPEVEPQPEEDKADEAVSPSDGSLAGKTLKFINLYWETDDLGKVEAVFDGGNDEPLVKELSKKDRGVYETTIPKGDYSRVSFRKAGSEGTFEESTYNFYGVDVKDAETEAVSFVSEKNNTFYYDMGENPSYWGADPEYEGNETAPVAMRAAKQSAEGVTVNPGDMVYAVDLDEREKFLSGETANTYRVHIGFLKEGHNPNITGLEGVADTDGEIYTMYEKETGMYSAPFPQNVEEYSEIGFSLVSKEGQASPENQRSRHFNFRGEKPVEQEGKKFGYFRYSKGYTDTYYMNSSQDDSYWGAHPSNADQSLDTQVLYVNVEDGEEGNESHNGIIADPDQMWISWNNMPKDKAHGYEEVESEGIAGYKIKNTLPHKWVRYFQFPKNSNATENTILTIQFKLKALEGSSLKPEQEARVYSYKFTYIPRSQMNCVNMDYIWEFNGQMWEHFEAGKDVDPKTIYLSNMRNEYKDVWVRLAKKDGSYVTREEINSWGAGDESTPWTETWIDEHVETFKDTAGKDTVWLKMDKVKDTKPFNKEQGMLFSITIPEAYMQVQFRTHLANDTSLQNNGYYYSGKETITDESAYPCYYVYQIGKPGDKTGIVPEMKEDLPEEEKDKIMGLTGYWASVYSVNAAGDQSVDIPEGDLEWEEGVYYVDTTMYDYYSDWEIAGRKIAEREPDANANNSGSQHRLQAYTLDGALDQYYRDHSAKLSESERAKFAAIYAAQNSNEQSGNITNIFTGEKYYNRFVKTANSWRRDEVAQGLMDSTLQADGKLRIAIDEDEGKEDAPGVEMPFFSEDFLRGNNSMETALGNVYKNVKFPITLNEEGYWEFDSSKAKDTFRLCRDVNEGYFMERREKEPISFRGVNGFFPFNDVDDWANITNTGAESDPGRTCTFGHNGMTRANYMFGSKFEFQFSLPKDRVVYDGEGKAQDITFEFQGDDDVWIYVDNQLVLDLGGNHDAMYGKINLTDGTYTIRDANKDVGKKEYVANGHYVTGAENGDAGKKSEFLEGLSTEKTHTVTMFYMERGLYESNLKMTFNFQRESTFTVEKEVDIESGQTDENKPNIFTEMLENMGGFQFGIKNLVTNGEAVSVENSAGYIKPKEMKILYNATTDADFTISNGKGVKTDNGYSVKQNEGITREGPKKEEMLQIKPKTGTLDLSKMTYMRLAITNEGANDANARRIYLAFEDSNGKRVGGYASLLGYDGENPTFILDEESIIRIDYRRMTGDSGFDWSQVAEMNIGIRKEYNEAQAKYTVSSIAFIESVNDVKRKGFSVSDDQISDYGSYDNARLTPVDKAWYTRQNKTPDGKGYDKGVIRQTENGEFHLADGQKAVFTDKFRSGSYIELEEQGVDPDVFNTNWSILEDGETVKGDYLLSTRNDVTTVKNPFNVIDKMNQEPFKDRQGTIVGDGREEIISDSWPNKNEIQIQDTKKTMLYRSYVDPDSTSNMPTDLGVQVKNTLKYGSITIVKKLDESMKNEDNGTFLPGEYTFDIYYTNIAGLGLETQLAPIDGYRYLRQTVTVYVDETGEGHADVPNIPAGTTYFIVERPSNGAKLTNIEIGPEWQVKTRDAHRDVAVLDVVKGEDGKEDDYSKAYVKGTAYASNQSFIFTNKVVPFYMDVEKIWRDNLTDEQRAELGITEVKIRIQRRVVGESDKPWENVTKDYFGNSIEEGKDYITLTAENGWKLRSDKELMVRASDDKNKLYQYRIQELNEDGTLNNYEVSYEEVPTPGAPADGYMHVTYRAINTTTGLSVVKNWVDEENYAGVRPKKIRMKMFGSSEWNPENPDSPVTWECYKKLEKPEATHQCDENCYIELTEGSGWRKSMASLPFADANGNKYYYKLGEEQVYSNGEWVAAEDEINGYQPEYSEPVIPTGENQLVLSATNTLPLGNIKIMKRDSEKKTPLEGAEFKLSRLVPEEGKKDEELQVDKTFTPLEGTTTDIGTIHFYNLPYGKYKIEEIESPKGYLLLKHPVYVTLDEKAFEDQSEQHKDDVAYDPNTKTITITILNEKGMRIPVTGGRGIFKFAIAGVLLVGVGTLLYMGGRKKSVRCRRHRK